MMNAGQVRNAPRHKIVHELSYQATLEREARETYEREQKRLESFIRVVYWSDAGLSLSAIADAVGKSKSRIQQLVGQPTDEEQGRKAAAS